MEKKRLLVCMRDEIRSRHYSLRTEQSYIQQVRRYIFFHNKRHPRDIGEEEISLFLTYLANEYDIRTIQELPGHKDVSTTMIYTRVLNKGGRSVHSPLDGLSK